MRYESPLNANTFRIQEEDEEDPRMATNEGRRITIRQFAGRAVGSTIARTRIHEEPQHQQSFKSRKQGPSHRKVRRWNNDNFINLAAEMNSSREGKAAAKMLMLGAADATKYRSVLDPDVHKSKAMTKFMTDKKLEGVRDQFYSGGMALQPKLSRDQKPKSRGPLTPEQMLNRIEARLRRVVVKACENSFPASKVVDTLENFVIRAYKGKSDKTPREAWNGILLEPPTVTHRKRDDTYVTRFLFDGEASNVGFHRLLLHGLCQFHGLRATSSTMEVVIGNRPTKARLLTATGNLSGPDVKLVEYIMKRNGSDQSEFLTRMEIETGKLAALKV